MNNLASSYKAYLEELQEALRNIPERDLAKLLQALAEARDRQQTIFIAGNGGNASTASHWATDLGKGLRRNHGISIKALSLSDNTSWISAVANDIDYDSVFADQLKAHGQKGDVLICLSASGESPNILSALKQAEDMGIVSFAIVGFNGGKAKLNSDFSIHIPTSQGRYGIVEDVQLVINHFICDYLAKNYSKKSKQSY